MSKKSVESKVNKSLLFVSHSYSTFVKDQIEQVSDHFDNVTILSRYNPISEISNILPIHSLRPFKKASIIDLSDKPSNVNVIVTPIFYVPTDSGYKNLGEKHFKIVERKIERDNIRFDLIHSHFLWSAGYVGAKLKEKYNVPFVVTAHGYDIYDLPFRDNEWKEKIRYVLDSADCIITVSNSNLKCIRELNAKTPVHVIPNGFRSDLFYPQDSKECRKKLNLPLDRMILLSVGCVYDEVKGGKYLIEAIREIVKHRKDILCILIGSGELKNKLQKQIKKAELENYIILAGGRPHNEIPIWMNACDIFVLPSLNEGNPTVMFECLGCGKPFVGTKVGGVPEIIISEDYGLLAEPANSKDLAEKILIALDKDWDCEKIRAYAGRFTWENITKEILIIYQHVI
ncbi:MAG: glycosyltransferase [Candidatus Methanoperedens sp.]|nr:glycosyltransferase [Candidatus Methanoperedens sp.]MCZ7370612.1 glycosyltransferase [Candidatus Methanoperedens sp.]